MRRVFGMSLMPALALAVLIASPIHAQQAGTITGRVIDGTTNAPVPGARVEAVTPSGQVGASALTTQNGQYALSNVAPGTYTLVVSILGYETFRAEGVRVVAGQSTVRAISLMPTTFQLNPVVVSASRRQEKIIDAPASVSVIDSRTVQERPAASIAEHLQGTPGIDIATSGVQSTNVVARGFNNVFSGALHTLTDNRIAGVPSLRVNLLHFVPATDDDIDRMEVVLGPGSALYGPNTANGVLHIITKSPLDHQGTSVTVGGGEQSVLTASFRTSQLIGENLGIKISGQYLQADEWAYNDPVELAERKKFAEDDGFLRQDLMRAAGIDATEADRRIGRIGSRDFNLERWGVDARADWRINDDVTAVVAAGTILAGNGIELTGLGAAQARDWRYSYVQARTTWDRLFAQVYMNSSDAGDTYLLRNGTPIVDKSKLIVGQLQHGMALGERQNFTYGLDLIFTDPVTEGTINGSYEDDDQTTEFGVYLQSETVLSPKFDLVLAGRFDTHSALPDPIFSPRAALVFKPAEDQAFRLTFNRAFSTPSSLNQWLDLGSAIPDEGAARLGYSLRVQGTGKDGFRFRTPGGDYMMRSPFTPDAIGGSATLLTADVAAFFPAAVQVVAQQAAAQGTPLNPAILNYLLTLTPTSSQISTNYFNPITNATGSLASLDLENLDPIRESTTTTFEVGYKGVIGERVLLAADVWYSKRENLVTPLTIQTPFLTLNPEQTVAFLAQRFMEDLGMPAGLAMANAQQLTEGLAQVPLGVISSGDINANSAQLLTTYVNVDDDLDLYGVDLAATALLTDNFSLRGTLSLVNDNVFETSRGQTVTLNAPKTKGSVALGYRNENRGFNTELRARFNDEFPVNSGVYVGTACLGDTGAGVEDCVSSSTLFDLTLGYRLPGLSNATLQVNVQNLFDSEYRSFPGVPTIGRMALVRLRYDF